MRKLLMALTLVLCLVACSDEDLTEKTVKYGSGVFILNEGNFGGGTGTVTFYDRDSIIEQEVFRTNNNGNVLGNVAQSMIDIQGSFFISVNNAGRVQVADEENFLSYATIREVDQPRMFLNVQNRDLYMTEWGIDGVSGKIHKIDPLSATIINTVVTLGGPEGMAVTDNHLFIAKSGGFGSDSLLLKYDMNNDEIIESFVVGHNPINIEVDKLGTLWILCTGLFDFVNPDNNTPGALVQFDNGQILKNISLPNGASDLVMDIAEEILYFLADGKIMRFDMKNGTSPETFYEGFFYAVGVDPINGDVYAADAKDFSSNGEVLVITQEGNVKNRIPAGIIPGQIYFKD